MGEFHRDVPYEGRPGQTHTELVHYTCRCGATFPCNVLRAVNVATDRELAEAAVAGNLNRTQCPYCHSTLQIEVPYVLHHPQEERFVLVIPEHRRHEALRLRAKLLTEVAEATEAFVPAYVAEPQVAFGTEGLRESLSRPPGHVAIREELVAKQLELEERERKVAELERMQQLREAQLNEKELAVEKQEESVMMREERLKERGEKVTRLEDDLRQREASQQARLEALELRAQMLEQREAELLERERALSMRTATLQEWEARLRATEEGAYQRSSDLIGTPSRTPVPTTLPTDSRLPSSPIEPPASSQDPLGSDIVTSLMHDPEVDDLPAEPTQRSRSMTSAMAEHYVAEDDDEEAEELTDDDLIEEAEEIPADDLIEGETVLAGMSVPEGGGAPASGSAVPGEPEPLGPLHSSGSSLPSLPGRDRVAPPVAPPPAALSRRRPLATPPVETPPPVAVTPEPAPTPTMESEQPPETTAEQEQRTAPEPVEPPEPFLEPPPQWVRSGAPTMHQVLGEDVYLLARVDPDKASRIESGQCDLWVQLHQMESYPLITLSLVLEAEDEEPEAVFWFLDIQEDLDRRLLQRLRRRYQADLRLFDMSYSLLGEVTLQSPREVNVARIVDRAAQLLGEIPREKLDIEAAKRAFGEGWDWAGKRKHPFKEDAYSDISNVADAKLALGILSYWSEPQNYDYLVLTKSVPVDLLDTITRRILEGAVRFGLWLPQTLKDRAVALALAPDVASLTARQVEAFAALGPAPEGLAPADVADNWQRLLREVDELDIAIDEATMARAEEAIEKASSLEEQEEAEGLPDSIEAIEELPDDQVLALLGRRATRTKAALTLAARKKPEHLEALFNAARKMSRADLVQLLPALLAYGEAAGDYFIEGLTSRKSFTRQACAIALGELKLRRAVVPLLHQLMGEETPLWEEIARVLGRYGTSGIKPLNRYLRDPKGKDERLVRAMASFAIHGAAKKVEEIAEGGGPGADLARQALAMRDRLRKVEEQVQGKQDIEDSDNLLLYSRRLYRAIAGEDEKEENDATEGRGGSDNVELDGGQG